MNPHPVDYLRVQPYNKRHDATYTGPAGPKGEAMQDFLKRTWAEINLDSIRHNYTTIRQAVHTGTKICWIVKADGYGHGAVFVARELEAMGADWFGVSNLEEALQLRRGGISGSILILGHTPPSLAARLSELHISQTVFSFAYAEALSSFAAKAGTAVSIHVKVDTGMSRIGFLYQKETQYRSTLDEIEQVYRLPGLVPEGIFTHFAVSDEGESGEAFTHEQYARFWDALEKLKARGVTFPLRHCSNSGAVLDYPEFHLDMVRPGIIVYGILPSQAIRHPLPLQPAMELKTIISLLKTVEPDTSISYGRCFHTRRQTRVATVPIGYADGYPRYLYDQADMLVCGKRAPIVGRVCMDQLMLDVTDIPEAQEGMTVTIFGRDGTEEIPVEELAALNHTIPYETICIVGKRVPRIYLREGRPVGQLNYICPPAEE